MSAAQEYTLSPTFHAGALFQAAGTAAPDVTLLSSDGVLFHAHTSALLAASPNGLDGCLSRQSAAPFEVSDDSLSLDIILRTAYQLDYDPPLPEWEPLSAAARTMLQRYKFRAPVAEDRLFAALLQHARLQDADRTLKVYALAGHLELEPLAVAASEGLLFLNLTTLTDDQAIEMGPHYLRRIFVLYSLREAALKRILGNADLLLLHADTPACTADDKTEAVLNPWSLTASSIVLLAFGADLSTHAIEDAFAPIVQDCQCPECKETVAAHIKSVCAQWAAVQRTI